MKKFITISCGQDSEGFWAHQTIPGLFDSPDAALEAFAKDWRDDIEFVLEQLDTGSYRIMMVGEGVQEGLIVPIEE